MPKRRGFSLLEMVIALGLVNVVIMLTAAAYVLVLRNTGDVAHSVSQGRSGMTAMNRTSSKVRESTRVQVVDEHTLMLWHDDNTPRTSSRLDDDTAGRLAFDPETKRLEYISNPELGSQPLLVMDQLLDCRFIQASDTLLEVQVTVLWGTGRPSNNGQEPAATRVFTSSLQVRNHPR